MEMRDGFVIETYDGQEVDFIACDYSGRMRERVENGLAHRVDLERLTFRDTRDKEDRRYE
jgi:hypothetical protein